MNNMNNLPRERKILLGVVAAVVLFCVVMSIGGTAFMAGRMSGMAQSNYAVQGYGPRQLPDSQPDAQGDVVPAPGRFSQQNDEYRPGPHGMAGPGWNRGGGSFFGGIFRLIGTLLFIGFIVFLVRGLLFRRWGWRGGMWGRGPWGHRGHWGGPWGGPGQGNSGVPPQYDNTQRGPVAPVAPAAPAAPKSQPTGTDKPQNPDAL